MIFQRWRSQRDHTWAEENLSAYLDDELPLDHKARLERHLAECAECRQSLHTLKQTVALLRRAPIVQPPVSFVLPPSAQRRQARYRQWQMAFGALRAAAVAASVILAVLLSADVLLTSGIVSLPGKSAEGVSAPAVLEAQYAGQESAPTGAVPKPTLAPSITPRFTPAPAVAMAVIEPTATPISADAASQTTPLRAAVGVPSPTPLAPTPEAAQPVFTEAAPPQAPVAAAFPSTRGGLGAGGAGGAGGGAESGGSGAASAEGLPALAQEPAELKATPPFEPSTLQRGPLFAAPSPTPETLAEPTPAPTLGQALVMTSLPTPSPEPTESLAPSPTPMEKALIAEPTPSGVIPLAGKEQPTEVTEPSSVPWTVWRIVRLSAVGLFGVILILLGGLLWVGQKRRW